MEFFVTNCILSIFRVAIGVSIAGVAGIILGLARTALPPFIKKNSLVNFSLNFIRYPPPIAWIPFVILLTGIGELSAYILVFIGAFPPIFTNTFYGAELIPQIYKDAAKTLELNKLNYLWKILLPGALPKILVGLRIGIGMGWMSVIAAELVSGQSGLGYSIQLNRLNLQYDKMFLDIFAIGLIGYALDQLISILEPKLIRWPI